MKTSASPSGIEILEDRIAPAGVVAAVYTAATGELTLTGDGLNNDVNVFQTGPNTYRVEGTGTDIGAAGIAFLDIGKLTKLTIDGAAGADTFTLTNLRKLTALSFTGGAGGDTLEADNLTVKGAVEFHGNTGPDKLTFGGRLTRIAGDITMDSASAGADVLIVNFNAETTVIGGSIHFSGGGGTDTLAARGAGTMRIAKGVDFSPGVSGGTLAFLNGGLVTIGKLATGESILFNGGSGVDTLNFSGANVTLTGGIRMPAGEGGSSIRFATPAGAVKIGKLPTGESILYSGGAFGDTLDIAAFSLAMAGGIDFAGGDGTNEFTLSGTTAKLGKLAVGQSIRFSGGPGSDSLTTDNTRLTLAGGIEYTPGDGNNDLGFENEAGTLKIGRLLGGQSILFTGGADDDEFISASAKVTLSGGLDFSAAAGTNKLEFAPHNILKIGKFGAGQSVRFASTFGSGTVDLGGVATFAGSVEISGGTGSDSVTLGGKVRVGRTASGVSVLFTSSLAVNTLEMTGNLTLAGSLRFDGQGVPGGNTLDLTGVDRLNVKGAVEMIGGSSNDTFKLTSFDISFGSLNIAGGNGTDTVSIQADGSIAGDVAVDLGQDLAATQAVSIAGRSGLPSALVLKGSLSVEADAANTNADSLTIANLSVARLIDLNLGGGASTVSIDNLIARGEFKLDTRDGADAVGIERRDSFGGSSFKKLATIQLGLDDDQLAIGRPLPTVIAPFPDHTRVNFLGGLTTDRGGGGNDNRNDFAAENTFAIPLTPPANFETMTLI